MFSVQRTYSHLLVVTYTGRHAEHLRGKICGDWWVINRPQMKSSLVQFCTITLMTGLSGSWVVMTDTEDDVHSLVAHVSRS